MTQHAVDLLRKYAKIINEAQQPEQLNEGVLDTLKQYASKLMKKLDPETIKQIATTVKQATGGDYSLTKANAEKVAQALGVSEEQAQGQIAEGISPTLGGKIIQALHLITLGVAGAGIAGLIPTLGGLTVIIGFFALMFSEAFWGNQAGQLGSEYDIEGDPLHHQEIRAKSGVTPTKPISSAGGFN